MSETPPQRGACINCGFFCRHDILNTHLALFREISADDRQHGRFFSVGDFNLVPWCFRGVDILDEIVSLSGLPKHPAGPMSDLSIWAHHQSEAALQVATRNRECPLWMLHQPGLGPEIHLAGRAAMDQEQRRNEFEFEMEARRHAFEERMEQARQEDARRADERQREFDLRLFELGLDAQRRSAWIGYWIAGAAVILAIAQVITGYLALTPESIGWGLLPWLPQPTMTPTVPSIATSAATLIPTASTGVVSTTPSP
jgi:hypothetical protein